MTTLYAVTLDCCGHDDLISLWTTPLLAELERQRLDDLGSYIEPLVVLEVALNESAGITYPDTSGGEFDGMA